MYKEIIRASLNYGINLGKSKGESSLLGYIVGAVVSLLVLFLLWPLVANQRNVTVGNANTTANEAVLFNIVGVFVVIGIAIGFILKLTGK